MPLEIKNLQTSFHLRKNVIQAVRGVSFTAKSNEVSGIVGESGSGKSVLALSLLRLLPQPPTKINGQAFIDNIDLVTCSDSQIRSIRGRRVSMIFQDPLSAFNPYMRLVDQLIEPLQFHSKTGRKEAIELATDLLARTGISNVKSKITAYPHEFSGGMLQRAMIAMALISKPEFLIADEITTALDVTTQAQILDLLKMFQRQYSLSILFITHNLAIASSFCDRIHVMYAGKIFESATTATLFKNTAHPYTKALIRCVPSLDKPVDSLYIIGGPPYDPAHPPEGCPFAGRCEYCTTLCQSTSCTLEEVASGHFSACIRVRKGEISV
ncbi:MAG TPA: ABC transporter ATP-binding protein [Chitinispirillaceae bacterium]|nr:ABC transporter ATP-binding protein [Chitinispirillaceae bacterium]